MGYNFIHIIGKSLRYNSRVNKFILRGVKRGAFNWDRHAADPTNVLSFPLQFRFTIPRSRKEREIILKNHLGQIVVSKVPKMNEVLAIR